MFVQVAPPLELRKRYVSGNQELWPVTMMTFGLELLTDRPLKPKKMLPWPGGWQSLVTGLMLVQTAVLIPVNPVEQRQPSIAAIGAAVEPTDIGSRVHQVLHAGVIHDA